jgi:hypothetical protein
MDRRRVYAGQYVTFEEWRQIDDDTEKADWNIVKDNGLPGIVRGLLVQEQAVPNLTVKVTAGEAYDKNGKRVVVASDISSVDVSVDSSSVSTQVAGAGNARVVSVFIEAARTDSNPKTDETSTQVNYDSVEAYKITVVQGSEVTNPPAHTDYPALDANKVLLADIIRTFGDTTINTADIRMITRPSPSVLGREDQVSLNPQPAAASGLTPAERSIRRNKVIAQPETGKPYADCGLGDVLQYHNEHIRGTASQHSAAHINVADSSSWPDGTTNPQQTLQTRLNNVVGHLASTSGANSGAAKVGNDAYTPTPGAFSGLTLGTVRSQLRQLADGLSGSVQAVNISYAGSGNWADATAVTAANVEAAIDEVVSDLAGTTGSSKIGTTTPRTNFSGANVNAQLADIDLKAVWLAGTQTITGAKTFSANPTIASGVALLPGSTTSTIGNASNNFGTVYTTQAARANTSQSIQFDDDTAKVVYITTRNIAGTAQIATFQLNPSLTVLDTLTFRAQSNNTTDLGTSSVRWKDMYATTYQGGVLQADSGYRMFTPLATLPVLGGADTTTFAAGSDFDFTSVSGDISNEITMVRAGEITGISFISTAVTNTGTGTVIVRVNGGTALPFSLTIPNGALSASTTRVYKSDSLNSFVAGDRIQIEVGSQITLTATGKISVMLEVTT